MLCGWVRVKTKFHVSSEIGYLAFRVSWVYFITKLSGERFIFISIFLQTCHHCHHVLRTAAIICPFSQTRKVMPREVRRIAQVTQLGNDTTDFQIQVFLALPSLIFYSIKPMKNFPVYLDWLKKWKCFYFSVWEGFLSHGWVKWGFAILDS